MFPDPSGSINCNPFLLTPNCPHLTSMCVQGITKQPSTGKHFGQPCLPTKEQPQLCSFNGTGSSCCQETLEKIFDLLALCGLSLGSVGGFLNWLYQLDILIGCLGPILIYFIYTDTAIQKIKLLPKLLLT